MKICACGCGEPINPNRENARYATNACRTRSWKQRTGYVDQRRRKPSRNANRRRADVRVSYRKLIQALNADYAALNVPDPAKRAARILEPLLTDHQKEALHG